MSKTIYITEEQEQALVDKYLTEALTVNSAQVSDIVNYLNKFYKAATDYVGDTGRDGLACPTMSITYIVNGQPLQKLKREELLDVINQRFRRFVKDDASRMAYYDQIISDWLNKTVKLSGQLSVNVIGDDVIDKYTKKKKTENSDTKKSDNESNDKKDNKENNKNTDKK